MTVVFGVAAGFGVAVVFGGAVIFGVTVVFSVAVVFGVARMSRAGVEEGSAESFLVASEEPR